MQAIAEEGRGLVIYEYQEGRGIGLMAKLEAYELQDVGLDTVEANHALGFKADCRDFSLPAAILRDLGVKRVRLLSNNPRKAGALTRERDRGGRPARPARPCRTRTRSPICGPRRSEWVTRSVSTRRLRGAEMNSAFAAISWDGERHVRSARSRQPNCPRCPSSVRHPRANPNSPDGTVEIDRWMRLLPNALGSILRVQLNRPAKRNAMTSGMYRDSRGRVQRRGEGRAHSRRALAWRRRFLLRRQRCGGFPEESSRPGRISTGPADERAGRFRQAAGCSRSGRRHRRRNHHADAL